MGSMSLFHWIIVGAIILLLFGGRNKISDLMGDMAKGIKSFKKGMADEDTAAAQPQPQPREPVRSIDHQPMPTASDKTVEVRKVG